MARKRQLTPSTTGSRVHAAHFHPLSPLPSHTVPDSRCKSSSSRCIAAHLRPAHKAMGDEGFANGTDSSCGWSSAKECGSRVRARSLVHFLLSSVCRDYYNIKTAQRFLQQQFLHAHVIGAPWVVTCNHLWCNDSQQLSPQELLWRPFTCSSSSYSPSEVGAHAPVNLGQRCAWLSATRSDPFLLLVATHQRCWRVLSPFLSADRGSVLSQKAQGKKHDVE